MKATSDSAVGRKCDRSLFKKSQTYNPMKNTVIFSVLGLLVFTVSVQAAGGQKARMSQADQLEAEGRKELQEAKEKRDLYNKVKDLRERHMRDSSQDFRDAQQGTVDLLKSVWEARGATDPRDVANSAKDMGESFYDTAKALKDGLDPHTAQGEMGVNLDAVTQGDGLKTDADKLEQSGQQKLSSAAELRKAEADLQALNDRLAKEKAEREAAEASKAQKAAAEKAAAEKAAAEKAARERAAAESARMERSFGDAIREMRSNAEKPMRDRTDVHAGERWSTPNIKNA